MFSRSIQSDHLLSATIKGHHALLKGRSGTGKSHLLDHVLDRIASESEFVAIQLSPITIRQALLHAAEQLHGSIGLRLSANALAPKVAAKARMGHRLQWDDIKRVVSRFTVPDLLSTIIRTINGRRCVIFVDSLEVPPTYFDALEELAQHAQIVAAMDSDNRRNRAVKFVATFPTTIELKPFPLEDSEQLIRDHIGANPMRFTDRKTEQLFVRRVAQEGRGVPGAILGILNAVAGEERITPAKVRMIQSEAAVQYLDMTPALVILLAGVMALRYIGKGIGETELIVISGVGTSLFIVIRFLFFAMRRK